MCFASCRRGVKRRIHSPNHGFFAYARLLDNDSTVESSTKNCAASIEHFLKTYDLPRYPSLSRETILEGFRLAKDFKHDIFDCMYIALALQEKAVGIVTTDTDFEKLCNQVGLKYINPVPKEILKRFKEQNK
jgi:predicted nucleic acid-binding protein